MVEEEGGSPLWTKAWRFSGASFSAMAAGCSRVASRRFEAQARPSSHPPPPVRKKETTVLQQHEAATRASGKEIMGCYSSVSGFSESPVSTISPRVESWGTRDGRKRRRRRLLNQLRYLSPAARVLCLPPRLDTEHITAEHLSPSSPPPPYPDRAAVVSLPASPAISQTRTAAAAVEPDARDPSGLVSSLSGKETRALASLLIRLFVVDLILVRTQSSLQFGTAKSDLSFPAAVGRGGRSCLQL
jgi:hypothetical protein